MPEWLTTGGNYVPKTDRDTFIDKSILSLFGVLSRIKRQTVYAGRFLAVNTALKVPGLLLLIVLLSISRNFVFVAVVMVYQLVLLSLMRGEEIIKILKVCLVAALFTFLILLPAAFLSGSGQNCLMITGKVFAGILGVNILSHTSKWHEITYALKVFFVPDVFVLVLDITIKYIVMLGDFSLHMLYALKLRSVGRNTGKYARSRAFWAPCF